MNRRNFVKGLLAIGAGFSILPPSTTYGRIWTVEKKVLLPHEGVGSIWQSHYMSWGDSVPQLPNVPSGTVHKEGPELFYRYCNGWVKLKPMTRMLPWRVAVHVPTKFLGSSQPNIAFPSCWSVDDVFSGMPLKPIPEMDENVPIPNLLAYRSGPRFVSEYEESKTIIVENGVAREL